MPDREMARGLLEVLRIAGTRFLLVIMSAYLIADFSCAQAAPQSGPKQAASNRASVPPAHLDKAIDLSRYQPGYFFAIDVTRRGALLAFGQYNSIKFFQMGSRKQIDKLRADDDNGVEQLAFNDGETIVASRRENEQTVEFWNLTTRQRKQTKARSDYDKYEDLWSTWFALSRKGDKVALTINYAKEPERPATSSRCGWVDIYSTASGAWLKRIGEGAPDSNVLSVAFGRDDHTLVTLNGQVPRLPYKTPVFLSLWDAKSGKSIKKLRIAHPSQSLVVSEDGKTAAVLAEHDDTATLVDLADGSEIASVKGRSADFSPDGKRFATGSSDGTVRMWDLMKDKKLKKSQSWSADGSVDFIKFSDDGHALFTQCTKYRGKSAAGLSAQLWRLAK